MIRIANAPCSWGVLEFELVGEPAGYAQVMDEIAAAGYAGTELGDWGFYPTDTECLADELAARNLALLGAFVPVPLVDPAAHAAGAANAVRIARLLAEVAGTTPLIVLADDNGTVPLRTGHAGRISPDLGLDDRQWRTFARGAEHVARVVALETGLRTVFHHHCAGYVETPAELQQLLDLTDPSLLGVCFDTGHFRYAGGDPVAGIRACSDRIWHVHFKDCAPLIAQRARSEGWDYFAAVRAGVFCELGQGEVDFPAVVAALDAVEYEGWIVVEQDVLPGLGTPAESAARNRAYLRAIGL